MKLAERILFRKCDYCTGLMIAVKISTLHRELHEGKATIRYECTRCARWIESLVDIPYAREFGEAESR